MNHALALLASVFEHPSAGAAKLDDLRAGWRDLAPENARRSRRWQNSLLSA